MWLFTTIGFFSIVSAWKSKSSSKPSSENFMIRVRDPKHLINLSAHVPALQKYDIDETSGTDYCARMIVPRVVFVRYALPVLFGMIDYTNFKNACMNSPYVDDLYHRVLHDVWHVAHEMQEPSFGD